MDYRFTIALIYYFDGTVGARGPNEIGRAHV